jgi:nitrous oxide reductase accessory protein NosL
MPGNRARAGRVTRGVLWALVALAGGCDRGETEGAPTIKYGVDQCVVCEMVINDVVSAAAVSVRTEKGPEPRLFDDIGELFDFEQEDDAPPILARYVHDAESKAWIDASTATFVMGDKIRTPMSSGIIAFANREAAAAHAAKHEARVLSMEETRLARVAWREARYGR